MSGKERWLLPEGIEEILPKEARRFEIMRRRLLDLFDSWGYELVMPPVIEYLESLLTGVGKDLDLQTFKLTDQLTGRMMGVRADITPQAARIDAHYLKRDVPVRLCYLGPVLRTRPGEFAGSREPLQLGAELFGHAGPESDIEILKLMLATLAATGIEDPYVDLGHVGVFRNLAAEAGLAPEQEAELFDALQRKARSEIDGLLADWDMPADKKTMLAALVDLHGDAETLVQAEAVLRRAGKPIQRALADLRTIAHAIQAYSPAQSLHFDLAELHGYRYYTGAVFSAFMPGYGQALAQGGRYDDIGKAFGRARAAAGFSADLRLLLKLMPGEPNDRWGILAPGAQDAELQAKIAQLRNSGERVVLRLGDDQVTAPALGCDRELIKKDGAWVIVKR
ncbi:MAG TPA: ATP phosphoribosyltransferase regulatory subunit [Acidiferrobacterales bacterium]|nr:ATP phosphoribosyltransferase regulatory subunit [Acidiferrobacterales bacterium]